MKKLLSFMFAAAVTAAAFAADDPAEAEKAKDAEARPQVEEQRYDSPTWPAFLAVWQVPQIFNWASYKKTEREKRDYRAPTYEEMRGMAWMCVANGANGLIFYSFFDLFKMDKTTAEGGFAAVREPFDERWGEVKKTAQEINDQFPILLSAGETLDVAPTDASSGDAIWRLYGTDEGTWLLVVNKSQEACQAAFSVPNGSKIVETRLGSPATQDGTSVRVELGALEPRLILIK